MPHNHPSSRLRLTKPIVLVGMMGVGKTSVGKRLAQRLRLPFVDSDHEIEAAAGLTIPEIFDKYGEPYFRDGERRVLARLLDGKPCVIATGGGAFMQAETRDLIKTGSHSVWIDADLETLVERVGRRDTRPLLIGKDPRVVLGDLLAVRGPVYAEAEHHVQSDNVPHEVMVDRIIAALSPQQKPIS